MNKTSRLPPHSIEAEEAVLGSVLIDSESLYSVLPFLVTGDFFLVKNQWVWQAILTLHERRAPIDLLTVGEELERRGQLADIGGQAYLSHLVNVVPTAIHAEGYGRIVEQTSIRRKLLAAASNIAQLAYEEAKDIDEVIDQAQQAIFGIAPNRQRQLEALPPLLAEYYRLIEARYERRNEPTALGVPTGFVDLDRLLGGLQRSDLVILAARPSVGKTSLLLNIALNAALRFHQRVAVFSMEMAHDQVIERWVAQHSGIDSHKLRTGGLNDEDWPTFVEAASHLSTNGQGLWIDDTPAISPVQMRSRLRWLQARHGVDLVIVDYLQLMSPGGKFENRTQEVSHLSRSLKAMAGELRVPVLAASQLSRAIEQRADKTPLLSDLRESGSIEQDSDVVMFLHRDDEQIFDPDAPMIPVELIVAKHRKGPTGKVPLMFRKSLTQFLSGEIREVAL